MKFNDLTGKIFGRLFVLHKDYYNEKQHATFWKCQCECGNIISINGNSLTHNLTNSCGCLHKEIIGNIHRTHGGSKDRLYGIWLHMRNRCYLNTDTYYKHYGGRGIQVCNEWKDNYNEFKKWAYENGYDDSAKQYECTIDRIDVNGDYTPNNCRWVNQKVQSNNTRRNHIITIDNESHTIAEWTRIMNYSNKDIIYGRLHRGWTEYDAVMTPIRKGDINEK